MAKKFLDETGLSKLWNKIKSMFVKKANLGENVNFNDVTEGGMYRYNSSFTNGPDGASSHGQLLVIRGAEDTIAQLCFPYANSRMFLRTGNAVNNPNGTWQGWVTIAINAPNGFNPDNFNDGSTWLNHTSVQNEVGNSNRPLVLYGTQIKNNSGQIMATEEYVNNKVGSGGGSVGTITKYELLGGDDIDLSVYGYSAIDVFIGSMNENSIGNIIFDNTDIHNKFAVTDRECYTANLHIRKVGSEFYAYYLDNNGNGKCFSFTDTDFNLSCDCSSSNTFYIVMEKR